MASPRIRGDYAELQNISKGFKAAADRTQQALRQLNNAVNTLKGGDWVGEGATAFYQEMSSTVLPSVTRLAQALGEAARTTTQMSRVVKQAEDDAAALFRGSGVADQSGGDSTAGFGEGGGSGSGTGGSGSGAGGSRGPGGGGSGSSGSASGAGGGSSSTSATTGKSLTVTGDTQGFADMANSIIGVQYKVVVDSKGVVALEKTDVQGPLTPAGQELVNTLQTVMNDAKPTTLEFVNGSSTVIVGLYATGQIDLSDIQQFGNGVQQGANSGGALVHEIYEQYRKQVHGESYPVAHTAAIQSENRATGATRGTETVKQINSSTIEVTIPYTYPDGKVINTIMTITNNNVTGVIQK